MHFPRTFMLGLLFFATGSADAIETLKFRPPLLGENPSEPGPQLVTAEGRTLLRTVGDGRVFETIEGALWLLNGKQIAGHEEDDRPFVPSDHDAIGEALLADLPDGFRLHTTKHYVIAYDTSREYAEWCSALLERLYRALVAYWKREGLELTEPRFPLAIVIHRSNEAYQAAARRDGVGAAAVGYYNLQNNRVRMYDLTGSNQLRATGVPRRGSRKEITRLLAQPIAEPLVATIVHEATHQVAFNTGIMQRFADLPLWLVEGMAVYFEAPDASSSRGWRGIGKVNRRRLASFQRHLQAGQWNTTALTSLIASDARLRDPRTGGEAYADAWAVTYYLLKRMPDEYVAYVKEHAEREPFRPAGPADESPQAAARRRLALFKKHFGSPEELTQKIGVYYSR